MTAIITYRDALLRTMRDAMEHRPGAIIFGQGVDDHKGTFGSTLGLAQEFGAGRVMDVPLAEEATTGIAIGAALNGMYPIHVHIRADFALLAMNQLVNLAAKYKYMFGGRFEVPMLVRMVIGRSWGQGAQHSQSLQSLFAHVPGLVVVTPATAGSVLECYGWAIHSHRGPVIGIEHRLLYDIKFEVDHPLTAHDRHTWKHAAPTNGLGSRKVREGRDVTIVATSIMVLEAQRAAAHLAQVAGIDCEIIDLYSPSHPDHALILDSVRKTGRLVVADTSWQAYGVAAEICRIVCEDGPSVLRAPVATLGMQPAPCPTAKVLEDMFYPSLRDLTDAIARVASGRADHGVPVPDEHSMADVYKRFKGPF